MFKAVEMFLDFWKAINVLITTCTVYAWETAFMYKQHNHITSDFSLKL